MHWERVCLKYGISILGVVPRVTEWSRCWTEERDYLWEDHQEQERFAENSRREWDMEMRSYCKDNTF
jgi:hypothetical protein